MDALDLLEQQHRDVGVLLDRARLSRRGAERSALAAEVVSIVVAHSHAEVRHVYAACADRLRRDDAQRFDDACARHTQMRATAQSLARARLSEGAFRARLDRLCELFREHEIDDERWIFQRSKCRFTDEDLDVLGARIASLSSPEPATPSSATVSLLRASRRRRASKVATR